MRIATYLFAILFATLALTSTIVLAEEKVYRWVDENGVVHFDSRPNSKAGAELVKLRKNPVPAAPVPEQPSPYAKDDEPSYAQQLRDERVKARKESAQKRSEIEPKCAWHKQRIAQLEPTPKVLIHKEDGSVERMDDADRIERLRESRDFVLKNCRH